MRDYKNTATKQGRLMNFQELIMEMIKAHSFKASISLLGAFMLFHLLPIAHFLVIGVLLVVSDTITGIWAAIKRSESINSKGLRRTIEKVVMYSTAICLVLAVESAFTGTKYFTMAVSLYIILVELFSVLENISGITGTNIIGAIRSLLYERFPKLKELLKVQEDINPEG